MSISKLAKFVIPSVVLLGALLIPLGKVSAKPEYSKKEKKSCVACHVKVNSKELNDVGKCYEKNKHSLEGCAAAAD